MKRRYICITSAGQVFLHNICVHFEYFSQRFCAQKHKGLFDYNSFGNDEEAEYAKNIIEAVFSAVSKCCSALEKYNIKVIEKLGAKHYSEIVTSPYYYEGQFHEERIILNHIQYLNAYRRYMIDMNGNNNLLNQYLIKQIRKYLGLLFTEDKLGFRSGFITGRSESTFNKLSVCIEEIVNSNYKNLEIDITSDYYRKHFRGKKCKFFREKSLDYFREVYR